MLAFVFTCCDTGAAVALKWFAFMVSKDAATIREKLTQARNRCQLMIHK
jgi:hypothetical protein